MNTYIFYFTFICCCAVLPFAFYIRMAFSALHLHPLPHAPALPTCCQLLLPGVGCLLPAACRDYRCCCCFCCCGFCCCHCRTVLFCQLDCGLPLLIYHTFCITAILPLLLPACLHRTATYRYVDSLLFTCHRCWLVGLHRLPATAPRRFSTCCTAAHAARARQYHCCCLRCC